MDSKLRELWAATRLKVWSEDYYLLKFEHEALAALSQRIGASAKGFIAVVVDELEVSVTCGKAWLEELAALGGLVGTSAPMSVITFDITLDFDIVGYMAVATEALAQAGISVIPQCAFSRDHLLVATSQRDEAATVLNDLIARALN